MKKRITGVLLALVLVLSVLPVTLADASTQDITLYGIVLEVSNLISNDVTGYYHGGALTVSVPSTIRYKNYTGSLDLYYLGCNDNGSLNPLSDDLATTEDKVEITEAGTLYIGFRAGGMGGNIAIFKIIAIDEGTDPGTNPEPVPNPDVWATAEVNAALDAGLVPDSVSKAGWQNSTNRLVAAESMVLLIENSTGKTMSQLAGEYGWDLSSGGFDDTNSQVVTFLKHAGITNGIGNNKYSPDSDYSRAQIVTMIGRTAEVFFGVSAQGTNPFTDVPDYAAPYVGYAADNGITQGVGGGLFDPDGVLQNQHTAVFSLRTYNAWK